MQEAVEQGPLLARLPCGVAHNDEAAGQDLDVIGVAPGLLRPRPMNQASNRPLSRVCAKRIRCSRLKLASGHAPG